MFFFFFCGTALELFNCLEEQVRGKLEYCNKHLRADTGTDSFEVMPMPMRFQTEID